MQGGGVASYDSLVEGDSVVEIHILLDGDCKKAADMIDCETR